MKDFTITIEYSDKDKMLYIAEPHSSGCQYPIEKESDIQLCIKEYVEEMR